MENEKLKLELTQAKQMVKKIADDLKLQHEIELTNRLAAQQRDFNRSKQESLKEVSVNHDLENITHWTNTITVMYSGQFVESGTTEQIFNKPLHPYTRALVDSSPSANLHLPAKSRLMTLPGSIPILQHIPIGCRLGPRCPRAQKACVNAPSVTNFHGHKVSCHFPLTPLKKPSKRIIKEAC